MTRKTVQALVALVIALVLLLFVVDRRGNDIAADREVLLPDLREHIGNAQQIRITRSSDGENITIDREGERWLVRERDGYPADVDKLGLLVSDLADAVLWKRKHRILRITPDWVSMILKTAAAAILLLLTERVSSTRSFSANRLRVNFAMPGFPARQEASLLIEIPRFRKQPVIGWRRKSSIFRLAAFSE